MVNSGDIASRPTLKRDRAGHWRIAVGCGWEIDNTERRTGSARGGSVFDCDDLTIEADVFFRRSGRRKSLRRQKGSY